MYTYKDFHNDITIFDNYKHNEMLSLICNNCQQIYERTRHRIKDNIKRKKHLYNFCSRKCSGEFKLDIQKVSCKKCNINFTKSSREVKRYPNNFCSSSCAATYNNQNKTHGTRRSKLEFWLEEQLIKSHSGLEIHFNRKDTIGSELDIYIPSLKLAFELNGIFHYEPIYGEAKLNKIKQNDVNKFLECQKQNISFCIIDTSGQKYFKESTSNKFLDIITNIINDMLGEA